jgi:hypothetical protein
MLQFAARLKVKIYALKPTTLIMIMSYEFLVQATVITIVKYNHNTFTVQATALDKLACFYQL